MEDKVIIQHYWDRDERAITETEEKYGSYCFAIADKILNSREDARECVNDTYLKIWNAIPPERPRVFPAFIGRIVRNLAFNRYSMNRAAKRGGGQTDIVLDELEECIPDNRAAIGCDECELTELINAFLESLPERNRKIFMLRYWCSESVTEISRVMKIRENSVSAILLRLRKKFRRYLAEKGVRM